MNGNGHPSSGLPPSALPDFGGRQQKQQPSEQQVPSAPLLPPPTCQECGHTVRDEFLFCPFCGTFLKGEST